MLIAKPVVPDQYWILRDPVHDEKIGNIQADDQGYSVRINDNVTRFKTLDMIQQRAHVNFQQAQELPADQPTHLVHGYPTDCVAFNGVWNVQRHLPLYTQEERSKSWFAAGWYQVKQHRGWKVMLCPKLIMLDRHDYKGPFTSKAEAVVK
jgi:hypothetical protein